MIVVENGFGAYDEKAGDGKIHDDHRIDHLRQYIGQMGEAVKDGVDLYGRYEKSIKAGFRVNKKRKTLNMPPNLLLTITISDA